MTFEGNANTNWTLEYIKELLLIFQVSQWYCILFVSSKVPFLGHLGVSMG